MENSEPKQTFWSRLSNTELFAVFVSIIALVVSAYAALVDFESHRDELGANTINDVYEEYRAGFNLQIEWPEISHLYAVSDYSQTCAAAALATSSRSREERALLRLREQSVALSLFVSFERFLFLRNQAVAVGDSARAAFLQINVDYYTERLLRNPRLRWLWSPSGGGLYQQLEVETREYYNLKVNGGAEDAPKEEMDGDGPFADQPGP